jgi:hypothetical protein
MSRTKRPLNFWTAAAAIVTALALCGLTALIFFVRPASSGDLQLAPVSLTVIPAPTATPLLPPTPTLDPAFLPTATPAAGEIAIGVYVQISGTDGEGLRLRDAPGLNSTPVFLGYDSEAFVVKDGPQQADGYTWWYLIAPYDEARAGWAAGDFLEVVPPP